MDPYAGAAASERIGDVQGNPLRRGQGKWRIRRSELPESDDFTRRTGRARGRIKRACAVEHLYYYLMWCQVYGKPATMDGLAEICGTTCPTTIYGDIAELRYRGLAKVKIKKRWIVSVERWPTLAAVRPA